MSRLELLGIVTAAAIFSFGAACISTAAKAPAPDSIDEHVLEDLPCTGARLPAEPDLVGLDSSARAAFDAARQGGIVVVHYTGHGCDIRLDVLTSCAATGTYAFSPYASTGSIVAHGLPELYTSLPLGASRLSSRWKNSPALRVDTMVIGAYGIKLPAAFHAEDLQGDCMGATHVVGKIYVGAFAIATGDTAALEARPSLFAAAGANAPGSPAVVQREGSTRACEEAQEKGTSSPTCDVPLRLGLVPITPSAPGALVGCAGDGGCGDAAPVVVDASTPAAEGGASRGMVHIAGGSFTMGPRTRIPIANDPMRHTVTVAPFDIDTDLVTVSEYAHCVAEGMCTTPKADQPTCNFGHADRQDHPMNCVDHRQASAYCHAKNERLPTEEEWEFAARGGAEERTYPWGNAEPAQQLCWSGITKRDGTCPVGSFAAGAFGLHDMAGNVWQWTGSVFSPERKDARVCRGGGWSDARALDFRGAYRDAHAPTNRDSDLGFRCAGPGP
jgi:formylglycine-generating enzyme required for sulfatase activity